MKRSRTRAPSSLISNSVRPRPQKIAISQQHASSLSLRCLVVLDCDQCGDDPGIVDGILGSSSAASLDEIEISKTDRGLDLGGEHVLRLVRGCPRLRVFSDFYTWLHCESDEDADEAREILIHRGGDAVSKHTWKPHPGSGHTLWSDPWKPPYTVRFNKYITP